MFTVLANKQILDIGSRRSHEWLSSCFGHFHCMACFSL